MHKAIGRQNRIHDENALSNLQALSVINTVAQNDPQRQLKHFSQHNIQNRIQDESALSNLQALSVFNTVAQE